MVKTTLFFLLAAAIPVSAGVNHPAPQPGRPPSGGEARDAVSTSTLRQAILKQRAVRGIHITSWAAGSPKLRRDLLRKIEGSVINAVVIAVKEVDGKVYIPGVETAHKYGAYAPAISRPEEMLAEFKGAGLYTIARIVVFKDKVLPRQRPDMAVRAPDGSPWRSYNGATWLDPYSKDAWDYTLDVAERVAKLGFDEVQFDYIRYPTEGRTQLCRYAKPHNAANAVSNLRDFLNYARARLKPYGVKISADVFGLTTTSKDDMGIGQDIKIIAQYADFVYPMMYPSHYYSGEYNIRNPNSQPYKVIDRGLRDAMRRLGPNFVKLRPYLQDFSLGYHYGPHEVRAQLIAVRRNLLDSWVLWNAGNRYNWSALTPQSFRAFVEPGYQDDGSKPKK